MIRGGSKAAREEGKERRKGECARTIFSSVTVVAGLSGFVSSGGSPSFFLLSACTETSHFDRYVYALYSLFLINLKHT